eukprot:7493110-Pyramimonas_sp.AAC.1
MRGRGLRASGLAPAGLEQVARGQARREARPRLGLSGGHPPLVEGLRAAGAPALHRRRRAARLPSLG